MIPPGSEANYREIKSDGAQIQPSEQVGDTVRELYRLLELYAPVWYTEELHNNVEAAVLVLGKVGTVTQLQASFLRGVSDT